MTDLKPILVTKGKIYEIIINLFIHYKFIYLLEISVGLLSSMLTAGLYLNQHIIQYY